MDVSVEVTDVYDPEVVEGLGGGERGPAQGPREERRGRWSFYSLDRDAAGRFLAETGDHLGVTRARSEDA